MLLSAPFSVYSLGADMVWAVFCGIGCQKMFGYSVVGSLGLGSGGCIGIVNEKDMTSNRRC